MRHSLRQYLQKPHLFSLTGLGTVLFLVTLGAGGMKCLPHPQPPINSHCKSYLLRFRDTSLRKTVFHIDMYKLKCPRPRSYNTKQKAIYYTKAQQRLPVHLSEKQSSRWIRSELSLSETVITRTSYFQVSGNFMVIASWHLLLHINGSDSSIQKYY